MLCCDLDQKSFINPTVRGGNLLLFGYDIVGYDSPHLTGLGAHLWHHRLLETCLHVTIQVYTFLKNHHTAAVWKARSSVDDLAGRPCCTLH